jgi:hypothetical protein
MFAGEWRERSPADAVRLLDRLRSRSRIRFPHRGVSVVELDFKSADVVLEGRLINNPDLKPLPKPDPAAPIYFDPPPERRFTAKYRFELTRIVQLKEHHWPKTTANKS